MWWKAPRVLRWQKSTWGGRWVGHARTRAGFRAYGVLRFCSAREARGSHPRSRKDEDPLALARGVRAALLARARVLRVVEAALVHLDDVRRALLRQGQVCDAALLEALSRTVGHRDEWLGVDPIPEAADRAATLPLPVVHAQVLCVPVLAVRDLEVDLFVSGAHRQLTRLALV